VGCPDSGLGDPAGAKLTFTYDEELRLVAITEAIGQVTTLSYESAYDPLKITKVTEPFGCFARFDYDAAGTLIRITDMMGLASSATTAKTRSGRPGPNQREKSGLHFLAVSSALSRVCRAGGRVAVV
jgi:YD repeat-containing protein